jgi:hypothetical protein
MERAFRCGRYPKALTHIGQLAKFAGPGAFATRAEVVSAVQSMFPCVDANPRAKVTRRDISWPPEVRDPDLEWLLITEWDYLVMVYQEGDYEWCHELSVVVWEGEKNALAVVRQILERFELRAWDRQAERFLGASEI